MRRLIILVIALAMLSGCAIYRPNDYCQYNDVMIIDVGDDNFIVTCDKAKMEKASIRNTEKIIQRCPAGTNMVIRILKDDEMVYKTECKKEK